MKGIILAAGRGSRMGLLTAERPKCLAMLSGKTLLERQIAAMQGAGIDEIAIVTGFKKELLAPFVARTFDNPRWSNTNMVVSLSCAREWLMSDTCIVSYSDIFYDSSAVVALVDSAADISLTYDPNWLRLWSARFENPLLDAETFRLAPDGTVAEIGKRAASVDEIEGQYMGLLAFKPEGWAHVEGYLALREPSANDKLDMTSLLARLIGRGIAVQAVRYDGCWGEVDNATDLALYEKMVVTGQMRQS